MKIWDKRSESAHEDQIMMLLLLTGASTHMFGYLFADYLPVISVTGYLWILSGAIFALEHKSTLS